MRNRRPICGAAQFRECHFQPKADNKKCSKNDCSYRSRLAADLAGFGIEREFAMAGAQITNAGSKNSGNDVTQQPDCRWRPGLGERENRRKGQKTGKNVQAAGLYFSGRVADQPSRHNNNDEYRNDVGCKLCRKMRIHKRRCRTATLSLALLEKPGSRRFGKRPDLVRSNGRSGYEFRNRATRDRMPPVWRDIR